MLKKITGFKRSIVKALCVLFMPIALCFLLTGCASIINGTYQDVKVQSTPSAAQFKVTDMHGKLIKQGVTPATVKLKRGAGSYGSNQSYTVEISKAGYGSRTIQLEPSLSNWYLFGNIALGGIIGWAIVDPLTGAMWVLEPDEINVNLSGSADKAKTAKKPESKDDDVSKSPVLHGS